MSKKNVSITSKESNAESLKRGPLSHIDDAINQTPVTKIAKNAPLKRPRTTKTEAFAAKKHGFDILDEAINKTPITKIVKDGLQPKKLEKTERKQYYEYVETDQDVLKNVIMAEFNLTEEMAKALSSEVRSKAEWLKNSQNSSPAISLPEVAPELYDNRPVDEKTGKRETPIRFYERVWKNYADSGLIFQDDFKNKFGESKLIPAIRSYCQRENLNANNYLPPPLSKKTELKEKGFITLDENERLKAAVALKRRMERKLHKNM